MQEQVQPGVPGEEGHQRGLAALEEVADGEGEETGQQQENHQEHIGDRGGEITRQFALHDGADIDQRRPRTPRRRTRRDGGLLPPFSLREKGRG
jgi:hypothetical protein